MSARRLKAITIRWDPTTYEIIQSEARSTGVTVAQFVREAALIRAHVRSASREAPGVPRDFKALAEAVERQARVRP